MTLNRTIYTLSSDNELVPEDGSRPLTLRENVSLYLTARDLTRTFSGYHGETAKDRGSESRRSINGYAVTGGNQVTILDRDGKPHQYRGEIQVYIGGPGNRIASKDGVGVVLFPEAVEGGFGDAFALSLWMPDADFDRLWNEIGEFRQPVARIVAGVSAYTVGYGGGYGGQVVFTPANNMPPVNGLELNLDDGDALVSRHPGNWNDRREAAPGQPMPVDHASFHKWVVGLLVLIAGLLAFKLG